MCGQSQITTHSVYDVNQDNQTSVTDAAMVVNRAINARTDDPQTVDAAELNALLEAINEKLRLLELLSKKIDYVMQESSIQNPFLPDENGIVTNGHEYVDLGMTDGNGHHIYWSTCNLGAEKPEDCGLYYAWGETIGYSQNVNDGRSFNWSEYKWSNGDDEYSLTKYCNDDSFGITDDKTELEPADDAAQVNWGGDWRIPTWDEQIFLRESCNWIWDNAKQGFNVISKINGNSIFMPATGVRQDSKLYSAGSYACFGTSAIYESYPSTILAHRFDTKGVEWCFADRCYGLPIRPVCGGGK